MTYLAPTAFDFPIAFRNTNITFFPSSFPSSLPSFFPSSYPSLQPFSYPSLQPSSYPSLQPSRQPSMQPSSQPSEMPLITPSPMQLSVNPSYSAGPTVSTDKTYVGILSYQDPYSCNKLASFSIYPTSACLVMANTHPDGSAFISGHVKYSCGSNNASASSYFPADTTCSQEPYDIYPLPNYDSCPAESDAHLFTCLHASSVTALANSVKGVVNK